MTMTKGLSKLTLSELAETQPAFVSPVLSFRQMPTISVVIPARNEAENLPHVLPRIPVWVDEVLLVDGNSTDDTIEVARNLRKGIRIVQQVGKGKGAALRTGFEAARGDIIVMLDADGSTDPAEIPAFVNALLAGADFAKGSRFAKGGGSSDISLFRRLGNWGFVLLSHFAFGSHYSDLCYGYNAFWSRVLGRLNLDCDGFEIETLMNVRACKAGLKVVEVPSFESERIHGQSNLRTIPDGWRVLKTILRERFAPKVTAKPAPAANSFAGFGINTFPQRKFVNIQLMKSRLEKTISNLPNNKSDNRRMGNFGQVSGMA